MKKNINKLKKFKWIFISSFLVSTINYIVNVNGSDFGLFLVFVPWLLIIFIYNLKSASTLKIVLFLLIFLAFIYEILKQGVITERVSTLIFILLIIAIFQQFFEIKKKNEN